MDLNRHLPFFLREVLDLRGPEFLLLFLGLSAAAALLRIILLALLRSPGGSSESVPEISPYHLAFLRGGPHAAVTACIVRLIASGVLEFVSGANAFRSPRPAPQGADPLERAIASAAARPAGLSATLTSLREAASGPTEEIRQHLVSAGYWMTPARNRIALLGSLLPAFAVIALGLMKILVGLSRDRPVGLLVILMIAAMALVVVAITRHNGRSARGANALKLYQKLNSALKTTAASPNSNLNPVDLAYAVALFDLAILRDSSLFGGLVHFMAPVQPANAANSSGISSCSTGSSCGGGGGCGGGGCGGCGS